MNLQGKCLWRWTRRGEDGRQPRSLSRNVLRARSEKLPIVVSHSLSSAMPLIKQHRVACCRGGVVTLPVRKKNQKPLSVALYHQHILFAAAAAAAAVWVMCVCVCIVICRVSSPLRHLHFQNAHKEHARSVKGNVEATRFITAWLRIHTCWVVNPTRACALSTHPVFASDQTLIVGFSS